MGDGVEGEPNGDASKFRLDEGGHDDVIGTDEFYEFRSELRQRITTARLIEAESDDKLLALIRKQFEFNGGMQDFCVALLKKFGLSREGEREPSVLRDLLGFVRRPHDEYQRLLDSALADLKTIEDLIAYYETLPPVQAFRDDSTPRNHADSTKVHFYQRCLEERERISRYLTNEMPTKALELADESRDFLRGLFLQIESPPYALRSSRGVEQFDHRRINKWRHRVRPLALGEGHRLGEIYEHDRRAFYSELFKHIPVEKVFDQIFEHLAKVEKLSVRTAVFEEMKTLHAHGHWYGLYALALPHVEGLFTEMLELADPANRSVGKALSEKVRHVRQYAATHAQNMDYFEFIVPLDRNRFAHTGKAEDPDLRAFEVLYDLEYVLRVFVQLETPVIELLSLIRDQELENAKTFAPWARLFALLKQVDGLKQRDQVKDRLDALWKRLFENDEAKREALDTLCKALEERLDSLAKHLAQIGRDQAGIPIDITVKRTREMFEQREHLGAVISEVTATSDTFFDALEVRSIMVGLAKECALPSESQEKVTSTLTRLATSIANVEFLHASSVAAP